MPKENPPPHREMIRSVLEGKLQVFVSGQDIVSQQRNFTVPFRKEFVQELTDLKVSDPVLELSNSGWAWKSCLQAIYRGSPITISFFLRGNKVLETRTNVAADCKSEKFEPL